MRDQSIPGLEYRRRTAEISLESPCVTESLRCPFDSPRVDGSSGSSLVELGREGSERLHTYSINLGRPRPPEVP